MLLGVYTAARIDGFVSSRAALRSAEENTPGNAVTGIPKALPEDSSLSARKSIWSRLRIKAYLRSIRRTPAPALAVLRIPRLQLEAPVLEGTDAFTLNIGVGRIPGTARLGQIGNVGIAGHRDGFFRALKDIRKGDTIELDHGTQHIGTYTVGRIEITDPGNTSVLRSNRHPELTLVTCYPFHVVGPAPQRYVVHAFLSAKAGAADGAK